MNTLLNTEYNLFFLVLLASFSLISAIMASTTVFNAFRLRNIRMSWRSGTLMGYPFFSTVFLLFNISLLGLSYYQGTTIDFIIFLFYFWVSSAWFITSYLTSKRFVTDHGIVKNINEPGQTIAWYQIRDFVEKGTGNGKQYIFLYTDSTVPGSDQFLRLELNVPASKAEAFKKLISHKLSRQINCYESVAVDVNQFDFE